MIEYRDLVLNNLDFKQLCNQELNCNAFLFESTDELFLKNFSLCFAQYIFCESSSNKPCGQCSGCKKVEALSHADLKLYPKSKTILVEDVKALIDDVVLKPLESDFKVFVFDNFSSANTQSQNKILKILEEPPKNTFIILNVSNINKILPTVLSRCKKIRLRPALNNESLKYVNTSNLQDKQIQTLFDIAQGSLQKFVNYSQNHQFLQVFDSVQKILMELKDSTQLIKYSTLINTSKQDFVLALEIFEALFRDLLMVRQGKPELVVNKNILDILNNIASNFDSSAIDLILKRIYEIKEKLEFNCNHVLLVDNLLLYILEVKFLCSRR